MRIWHGVRPVSYTHLDVYKRQDLEGELCVDREIELYKLKRNYEELKEMLGVVKINDMKYLPVNIEIENCFDDTCLNNNNLPSVVMNEKITDLISVSYTHLDVYKRQVRRLGAL